ncbi:hypothetical protein K1719_039293 [Acacia pycnantha]|nr:hypothetical protein K1719_039293 [Acacia pycnantha]
MEMKLNDELQVKLNEHEMKIREQQRKMIELSIKIVAKFDRVEKEIRLLGRWARVFVVTIVVVGAIFVYVGGVDINLVLVPLLAARIVSSDGR